MRLRRLWAHQAGGKGSGMVESGTDDASLVAQAASGSEHAFRTLYRSYVRPVYWLAHGLVGNAADAEDVTQETFLALLRGDRFDAGRGTLAGYLFGIARHHILKRLAVTRLEAAGDDDRVIEATAPDEPSPFDDLSRTEAVEAVRAAIQSLPSAYREIITLCELEELDYAAAAGVIECPVGTVRSRLHRAKALLSAKLVRLTVGVRRS